MSLEQAKEMAKCSCGGSYAWHWRDKKSAKEGFSGSVVKCGKCGKKMSAEDAHEFTQAILKQV